jgi:hypothetical protein
MKYFVFIFLLQLFFSCDPMRRIDMKNNSSGDVEITWTLKEMDSLYKSPFFLSNSKKIKFKLQQNKPFNEANMSFGSGIWTKEAIDSITNRLDSLEIKSSSGTLKMDSKEMNAYLMDKRKGLGKRKIIINTSDISSNANQ